ncbi:RTC4-like domain-containing protein [Mucor mucedo]|uniref:RTC4-like domain-containing protein n=1 Tax=Mucor mucedo TaxID=29922 RepID=UPI00221FD83C|nr:RTC4-like domain-containing protein [Mucor mucedo]KAI7896064.1 RTC4-like domain-containing protein [Mucor mucedo]
MGDKRPHSEPLLQSNKRLKRLTMPKRVKKGDDTIGEKLETIRKTVTTVNEQEYECNLCGEVLKEPYPRPLKRLIDTVKKNEREYRKEQEEEYKVLKAQCEAEGRLVPPFTFLKGGISKNDQSFICRMHKVELVYKPMAIEKGYPTHIEFEEIGARVKLFESELKDIVEGRLESSFLETVMRVHQELGSVKARQTKQLMTRFEETLPGYYGNRGSHYILEALDKMFVKTDYLDKQKTSPLTPVEYMQQVMVPECGIRLIKQDLNLENLQEASKVMKESSEYGSTVYNKLKKK